jgi:hypothetical protein
MLSTLTIPWTLLRVSVLASYFIGMFFGSGLHVHSALSHEHNAEGFHRHSLVVHVHITALMRSADSHSENIFSSDSEHGHQVPQVQLIAIRAPHSKLSKSVQQNTFSSFDIPSAPSFSLPRILLFVFAQETSPPLHSLTVLARFGRSPPVV